MNTFCSVCGVASPWFPYLQSLPRDILGIPLFWTGGAGAHADSGGPTEWLNGTEAWKMLFESAENHASLFVTSLRFWNIFGG